MDFACIEIFYILRFILSEDCCPRLLLWDFSIDVSESRNLPQVPIQQASQAWIIHREISEDKLRNAYACITEPSLCIGLHVTLRKRIKHRQAGHRAERLLRPDESKAARPLNHGLVGRFLSTLSDGGEADTKYRIFSPNHLEITSRRDGRTLIP